MDLRCKLAFENRVRRVVDLPGREPFSVWVARPEDVIVGKLMAWDEGRSDRHPSDIYEMMLFYYLGGEVELEFNADYVLTKAGEISGEAAALWTLIENTAREEASQN